jgi:uncharacterized membrane protein YvbJ
MEHLNQLLKTFEDEEPNPTQEQLYLAFGTPENMAETLLNEIQPAERKQWIHKKRMNILICGVLFAVLLVGVGLFIGHRLEPVQVTTVEQTYIYEGEITSNLAPISEKE